MSPTGVVRTLVTGSVVVLVIGTIDAGISSEWDLFVIFSLALIINLVLMSRIESRRPAIPIRRDLVAWLRDRASISGESLAAVTDRAIATYVDRYGVAPERDETPR